MTKILAAIVAIGLASGASAHDEGHGPKLTDSGKYGGIVSGVINLKDAKKGAKAELVYKAELVRSPEGKVRVYLYDKEMKPLELAKIEPAAKGILGAKVKGKYKTDKFDLKLEGNTFIGDAPKAPAKPYNLDFQFKEPDRELLTAFDNLD
ncbi:MAG TPA: hypothetical protein VFV50_13930 [Bdellovibrionales bacterium]|nr:hypothetical protein [Bdellovibrionales bacterium]